MTQTAEKTLSALRLIWMGGCVLCLSACSSSGWVGSRMPWIGVEEEESSSVSVTQVSSDSSTTAQETPLPSSASAGMPTEDELFKMASQSSRNHVQIYRPDGDDMSRISSSGSSAWQQNMGGMPSAQDSRVTIFPLDEMGGSSGSGLYAGSYIAPGAAYMGGSDRFTESAPSYTGPIEGQRYSSAGGGSMPSKIYFAHGSSRLDSEDRRILSQVAEEAKFAPVARISIEGHASSRVQTSDPVQARILNLKQSMNRAVAVSNNLIQNGVPPEKIKTLSWGDTKPPANGSEAEARRVDIYTGGSGTP